MGSCVGAFVKRARAALVAVAIAIACSLPGRPAGFHYILQRGDDFRAWMRTQKVWSVYEIRGMAKGEHLVAGERWVAEGPPERPREG